MTDETARWLLTEPGQAAVQAAMVMQAARVDLVTALSRLRKASAPEHAAAAWEMADLRQRARAKFGDNAVRMWFVREALEQATSARVAEYHAQRFSRAGIRHVADVCGGIGGDALAFARAGLQVTLYEQDAVRALFAQENARILGLAAQIRVDCCDVRETALSADAVWFDPARRAGLGRVGDPEEFLPPLSLMRQWEGKPVGVKLTPALDHSVADLYSAELEFLSERGECKEALLWTGALRSGAALRAVLLQEYETQTFVPDPALRLPFAAREEPGYLYEPDPAVIRAGGVAALGAQLNAKLAASQIAYLIGPDFLPTPFAAAYPILDRFSFSIRRLQAALSTRNIGHVVIKKRGFPKEPEAVRKELKLRGTETITVVLTRSADGDGHQVILCGPSLGSV